MKDQEACGRILEGRRRNLDFEIFLFRLDRWNLLRVLRFLKNSCFGDLGWNGSEI